MMAPQFVVTPWRDADELLMLRRDLFAADAIDARERAVNTVLAWRVRKLELPLLLESTADLVEASVRDEKKDWESSHALRLVYATAISRFITGLLDTQTDLARLALPSQTTPPIPLYLRETRHRIVHRHLPSLAELKRGATESLDWLWEHYWSHLDALLTPPARSQVLSEREVKERLQGVLKSYVKERKAEIKSRSSLSGGKAAENAIGSWWGVDASTRVKQSVLLDLLIGEKNILPMGKKIGTSMEGAYLIWTPFLFAACGAEPAFLQALTQRMVDTLVAPARGSGSVEDDPAREGMHAWSVHILTSDAWRDIRRMRGAGSHAPSNRGLSDNILGLCFTTPTFWTLKLVGSLLEDKKILGRKSWLAVLEAAKSDGEAGEDEELSLSPKPVNATEEMDVDTIDSGLPVSELRESTGEAKKAKGPQKYAGLWRPQPIGWIPPGSGRTDELGV